VHGLRVKMVQNLVDDSRNGLLGSRYYQEIAPGVAMDRAEVLSITDTLATPAGYFYRLFDNRRNYNA